MNGEDLLSTFFGFGAFLVVFLLILVIGVSVVIIIAQWKLFKKAGKNGWEALIPFYSTWVLVEISGLNWWYFLIAMSSFIISLILPPLAFLGTLATYFANFLIFYNIAKKMKQNEVLYGVLGALVTYVAVAILGFSKNITFDNSIEVSPNGAIGEKKNNQTSTNNTPERYCLGCGQKIANDSQFCGNCGKKVE